MGGGVLGDTFWRCMGLILGRYSLELSGVNPGTVLSGGGKGGGGG